MNGLSSMVRIKTNNFDYELYENSPYMRNYALKEKEGMTPLLIIQMAKKATQFINIGSYCGLFEVLVGNSNPNCEIYTYESEKICQEIIQNNLTLHDIHAHILLKHKTNNQIFYFRNLSDSISPPNKLSDPPNDFKIDTIAASPQIVELSKHLTNKPTIIRIDTNRIGFNILDSLIDIFTGLEDIRLFIKCATPLHNNHGSNTSKLFSKLNELGFQVHVIDDKKRGYYKIDDESVWEKTLSKNFEFYIYCRKREKALNLCFFSHTSQLAGAERRLINFIDELISMHGVLCTVVLPSQGPLKEKLNQIGGATLEIPYDWWCNNIGDFSTERSRKLFQSYLKVRSSRLIEKIQPDIIISNSLVIPWGAVLSCENDKPHIWMINEFGGANQGIDFFFGQNETLSFIQSNSERIITCSNAVRSHLFDSSEIAEVIYDNFTNLRDKATSIKSAVGVFKRENAFHLLLPGTISSWKGQLDAVKAVIKLIKNEGENIELILVGYAVLEYQNEIDAIIQHENLGDSIRILPFADDIYPIMKSSDAILLCSKNEAFGRIVIEGMLLSKPVIGTNAGGIPELIQDGMTGLLYSPGNYFHLADHIQALIHNQNLRNQLAVNGNAFALESFCKQNFLVNFYNDLIEIKNKKHPSGNVNSYDLTDFYQSILDGCNFDVEDPLRINIINDRLRRKVQTINNLECQLIEKRKEILTYSMSKSWQLTRPFRKLWRFINRSRGNSSK